MKPNEYKKFHQKGLYFHQIILYITRFINFIWSNRKIIYNKSNFLFILSIFATLIGVLIYDISPLQPLEEIKAKQIEYRQKQIEYQQKEADDKNESKILENHLKLGNSFLNVLQLDAAKDEFNEALKLDPLNLSARKGLFKSELFRPVVENNYDPEIMEKRIMLLIQEDQNDTHALLFLGHMYIPINDTQAMMYFQKVIDIDPSFAGAYFEIGLIYDEQKNHDEAIMYYERALNLSKWNQLFLDNLGYQYYLNKDFNKAIEKFELLLRLNENYLSAYYIISNSYRITGNMEQARLDQEKLITLLSDENVTDLQKNKDPWYFNIESGPVYFFDYPKKNFHAYYNIALTYYLLGNELETMQYLKKAKDLHIDKESELDVLRLVDFDMNMLEEKNPSLLNRTEEFKRKFF
jgi:tetratricopeptide (TPR) repeat protein